MPVYEFYCQDCHRIFNFFSKTVNTSKIPSCPKCGNPALSRRISKFAVTGRAKENSEDDFPIDETKMEKAMMMLAKEAENMPEDDPREGAKLMRRLTEMTGLGLGPGMEEALRRMENGEDPETVEAEMGDVMENGDPFVLPDKAGKKGGNAPLLRGAPKRDDHLYDL